MEHPQGASYGVLGSQEDPGQAQESVNWQEWLWRSEHQLREYEEQRQQQESGGRLLQRLRYKLRKFGGRLRRRQSAAEDRVQNEYSVERELQSYLALEPVVLKSQNNYNQLRNLAWLDCRLPLHGCGENETSHPIRRSHSEIVLTTSEKRHLWNLMDLVVEVAYPRCAICRLRDGLVSANKSTMSLLHSGQTDTEYVGMLIAGSQAEGLALEVFWGHPLADTDIMWLIGGRLGVYIPEAPSPRGSASLEYHPDGCPPAYCNLEVTDPTALREAIRYHKKSWWKGYIQSRRCTPCVDGRQWLNTYHTVRLMTSKTVSGPAGQSTGPIEDITTLVCSGPHPALQWEFRHRSRKQWPTSHVIEYILKLPMLLVLVGHKFSKNFKREARISWSHCETKIMQELSESVRQGYIACKYVLKYFLAVHRGQTKSGDGRSRVGSFHIKTVFLHYLEKRPPHMIKSTFGLFVDLLHNLDHHLESGELPHYFLSECNLLETVDGEERRIARQAIQAILSDPLAALLTSPTRPQQIYGELRPDALVHNFRRVITHPMCQQNWKDLSVLLARIDECRHECYCEQRRMDESWDVSGPPELIRLVEALKSVEHS